MANRSREHVAQIQPNEYILQHKLGQLIEKRYTTTVNYCMGVATFALWSHAETNGVVACELSHPSVRWSEIF